MKIVNLKRKLESIDTKVEIDAKETRWGGWNVTLQTRIGGYYDIQVREQVHKTLDVRTKADAIATMLAADVDYFCSKPYHDESDSMTDYCAWSFNHRLKDVDWLMENSKSF